MTRSSFATTASLLLLLSGCSGEAEVAGLHEGTTLKGTDSASFSDYVDSLCDSFGAGATAEFSTDVLCRGCDAEQEAQSVDGHDASYALLNFASLTQGPITLRATAPAGVVFPAGTTPGITFSSPQNESNIEIVVRTYLQGVEQNRDCMQGSSYNPHDREVIGLEATKPFDALEVTLKRVNLQVLDLDCGSQILSSSNAYDAPRAVQLRVHEFCHHFRIP